MNYRLEQRDYKEGWPLLTVETAMNGDSTSTNDRGPSLVGSLGLLCWLKRFLFSLGCSSRPSKKYFFPHRTQFEFICPHHPASWAAVVLGRLSLSMCLWIRRCNKVSRWSVD